ncbi:carboxymuconolactone decarboxylase family protein [Rhodobium gokarnense]|uniref:AhpD family alkylhydroperoxidase n=1 Tax=Rhodobium gokarnense TaxID=364296 RepID=A0ABT3H7R2_9HYPH|nr:carboxymuconolactone decarboxylase family protein [Rhodobium gokarnense]MCW2306429.1 AhpD family alkylhydroperoxidase [Rhodobium gokarnense]
MADREPLDAARAHLRVPPKALKDYPLTLRPFFWNQKRKYGAVLDGALLWGRSPWVFRMLALLYGAFDRRRSPVDPAMRSLLTVRVSQLNGCAFCIDLNTATLLKRGVSEEKAFELADWRTSPMFDARERLVLELAERMTRDPQTVDDDLIADLGQHYDHDGIVELAGLIAFQNMSAKFNTALGVPPKGFCRVPLPTTAAAADDGPVRAPSLPSEAAGE